MSTTRRASSISRSSLNTEEADKELGEIKKEISILIKIFFGHRKTKRADEICSNYDDCNEKKTYLQKTLRVANSIIKKKRMKTDVYDKNDIETVTSISGDKYKYFIDTIAEDIVHLILLIDKKMQVKPPDLRYKPSQTHHKRGRTYTAKRSSNGGGGGKKHNKTRAKRI